MPIDELRKIFDSSMNTVILGKPKEMVQSMANFIDAAMNEIATQAFQAYFRVLKPVAVRLGANDTEYEFAFTFSNDDCPDIGKVFDQLENNGSAFSGKWGFTADSDDKPTTGTISFELERDYIEFKMRME